ncbi:MAG: ATP-binding protein [Anaerocolumna sp.]
MYRLVSGLVLYRDMSKNSILYALSEIFQKQEKYKRENNMSLFRRELIGEVYTQVNKLLSLATKYGFDQNLWQNYLTYLLITNENPYSIICEKKGKPEGCVNQIALADIKIFKALFHYDFSGIENDLGINIFSILTQYEAVTKDAKHYNANVSEKVINLCVKLSQASTEEEFLNILTRFYKEFGVGDFGLNKAFRLKSANDELEIIPITNTEDIILEDLIGYELQKKKLVDNTEAFLAGHKANNVLLFGDSGTGKSTSVKAILNKYYDCGLRIIEIYKHQFGELSEVIAKIKDRNYKFIIYMDDLSFEEFEIEYKYLKAVIEGGLEIKPDNVLIYATSNRRHLIRETWSDRSDISKDELHRSDTMQEKLSLVARFGITINFASPSQKEFFQIVTGIAKNTHGLNISEDELCAQANIWEMSHGGRSGRTAQQFINYLIGQNKE